jgi:hypothetical protein
MPSEPIFYYLKESLKYIKSINFDKVYMIFGSIIILFKDNMLKFE